MHLCVATVGAPDGDHSGSRSFPIWLGPAKKDLTSVMHLLVCELNHLQKGQRSDGEPFYCLHKKLRRMVRVQVCPYCWIGDKQDTAEITQTLQGSSNFHLRYGFSMDYYNLRRSDKRILPACEQCLEKLSNLNFENISKLGSRINCNL